MDFNEFSANLDYIPVSLKMVYIERHEDSVDVRIFKTMCGGLEMSRTKVVRKRHYKRYDDTLASDRLKSLRKHLAVRTKITLSEINVPPQKDIDAPPPNVDDRI